MNTQQSLSASALYLALGTAAILTIPFIAMQFSSEVVWTLSDFIFAATLIFGTGFTYLFLTRNSDTIPYRIAMGFALGTGFLLIWSNLAVGIIGSESNVINLLYFGVIAIGVAGAVIARFKAGGMMITLFILAFAQSVIAAVAILDRYDQSPSGTLMEIIGVNGFFVALWVVSALLFRHAMVQEEDPQAV